MSDKQPRAEQLAMQVLGLLPLCYKRVVHQRNRDGGLLTPMQQQALMVLAMSPHPLSMTQLARALDVSRQQLTKLVDALCAAGFVLRRTAPENRRTVLAEATEEGHRYIHQSVQRRYAYARELFSGLNPQEEQTLLDAFTILHRLLEQDPGMKEE